MYAKQPKEWTRDYTLTYNKMPIMLLSTLAQITALKEWPLVTVMTSSMISTALWSVTTVTLHNNNREVFVHMEIDGSQ